MQRTDSLEKTLVLGKIESGGKKTVTQDEMVRWHHRLNGHNLSKLWKIVKDREALSAAVLGSQRVGLDLLTERQQHILPAWPIFGVHSSWDQVFSLQFLQRS